MINREMLHTFLKNDLYGRLENEAKSPDLTFAVEYQLDALNRKANNGSVSKEQTEFQFKHFVGLQKELKDFNQEFDQVQKLFPEFAKIKHIISEVLPPLYDVEDEIWPLCTFGPGTFHGAIKGLKNVGYSIHYKVGGKQTVTPKARYLALDVIATYFPHWREHLEQHRVHLEVVTGNRLAYVPKDVRKCRPIAIEPSLNVFLQQGVGRWLGKRLRNLNFADIYDGQLVQRRKASDLANATIDLSNASDTISLALCRAILPADWYELLDTIRSRSWSYKNDQGTYENISSQGNAFTFPLETMIFKAVCMAFGNLSKEEVTVYGDDIIVPLASAEAVVDGLELAGFTVNKEKSFYGQHDDIRRNFRESCGADFLNGNYITPVYYRQDAERFSDVATLYNRLYERWGFLAETHNYLRSIVPQDKILWGPMDFISDAKSDWWMKEDNALGFSLLAEKDDQRSFIMAGFKKPKAFSHNYVVRTYSSWFWINEVHDFPSSSRRWESRARKLSVKDKLNEYSSYMCFLLGQPEVVPRLSRATTAKADVVSVSERLRFLKYEADFEAKSFDFSG